MTTLSISEAVALVRKNLDEMDPNASVMYTDEGSDNFSLSDIITRNLPEAINEVGLAAPVQLLEGETIDFATDQDAAVDVSDDGVLSVSLPPSSGFLRLVAFKAADSPVVVTDILAEASPEGRKQLNPYIRGRWDRPRLVSVQGEHTGPEFRYYTLDKPEDYAGDPASAISLFSFLKEQSFKPGDMGYDIPRRLKSNIIDCLTAKVLETYSDQRAQSFYQKASIFPNI